MYKSLRNLMMKNLLCIAILVLFAAISLASATEIVIDIAHHHLGDNFKEELTPGEPGGLIYTATFNLDSPADIRSAELTLTAKSVVPGPAAEFLDRVYLNEKEIGALNDYIPAQTPDDIAIDIAVPIDPTILKPGTNTIKITSGSNAEGSNYDDFEFYNLAMHLTETEPITLEPPLKVAWTYELSSPFSAPPLPVSLIAENAVYLDNGISIKALDADTGELLWNKEWSANLAYNEGVLFAVHYPNVDALNAKTGTLLWRKEYLTGGETEPPLPIGVPGENPVIFGDTLYVSSDKHVSAIDTANGNLKWRYELTILAFGAGGRNHYSLSIPAVSEDIVVFQFHASHSSYAGPPVAIEPDEPAPELGETITKRGLIALNTKTGEVVWEYAYAGEVPFLEPFIYKDLVYTTLGDGTIIALSIESGEEVWKANVGDWATIAAVEDGKLFFDSNKAVILDADTGEILKEYPDSKLRFSKSAITDGFIYSTSRNKIYVFDSNTGELVWTGGRIKGYDASAPTLYKDKLYLTSNDGRLYAFEHGAEHFALEPIHIYLATLAILVLLGAIAYKKGFTSKLRIKNKVLRGVMIGATPFLIIALSLLYVLIVEEYYHGMVQEGMGLAFAILFVFSLIAAVIAGIIGGVLGYVLGKD